MTHDTQTLIEQARGETIQRVRAVARLMSLIENAPERASEFLIGSGAWPQPRMVLGVTGPPGCGKSVLTDRLVTEFRTRRPEEFIGVIAVDPSSPVTGGAFLGDRLRMMRHADDPHVFIRSAATRGHVGGLSLGIRAFIRVLGLAGCQTVIIETVGVGQNETEIAGVADVVLVTIAPGDGDAIQLLKAGLMEVGDIFVVNKADCDGAAELYGQLLSVLHLQPGGEMPRSVETCLVSAARRQGVDELVERLEKRAGASHGGWEERRRLAIIEEVRQAVFEEMRKRVVNALDDEAANKLSPILRGELTVSRYVDQLVRQMAESHDD